MKSSIRSLVSRSAMYLPEWPSYTVRPSLTWWIMIKERSRHVHSLALRTCDQAPMLHSDSGGKRIYIYLSNQIRTLKLQAKARPWPVQFSSMCWLQTSLAKITNENRDTKIVVLVIIADKTASPLLQTHVHDSVRRGAFLRQLLCCICCLSPGYTSH